MKTAVFNFLCLLCMLLFTSLCFGADDFDVELLAKAEIDECYNGIGEPYVPGPVCSEDQIPKANQSYLWGLARSGDNMWIGTGANILCMMRAAAYMYVNPWQKSDENEMWVCEYAEGQYPEENISRFVPKIYSDFRQPKVYTYNLKKNELTDISAKITSAKALRLLENTFGMRSAAAFGNLVFMAGPVGLGRGINIFAFNAGTGDLIDSKMLYMYSNIRKWLVLDGVLYTTVQNAYTSGGKILRWSGTEDDPIAFTVVGNIDTSGTEIVSHDGRIYVATWPQSVNGALAGIWMSPKVPNGGLTEGDADSWEKVWEPDSYEPDPLIAHLYGVGALHSYKDQLYWGTMHVSSSSMFRVITAYLIGPLGWSDAYVNSQRAVSLFRTTSFDDPSKIELLYGEAELPVYTKQKFFSGYWSLQDNNMGGQEGIYGTSGFGNPYNNYTWTMAVYNDKLFVGTMDNSILWLETDESIDMPGADLWYFPSENEAALSVTLNGFDNPTNYGIRTIYSDDTGLYCGTANPGNIAQNDSDEPIGGWELLRVSRTQE